MTNFESKALVNTPASVLYEFLSDLNNHQKLMPENIYNWSSTKDEAKFTIQNMAKLILKVASRTPDKEIRIIPSDEAPFDLELKWVLSDLGNGSSEVVFIISAELNMMMKMLAAGPLQKLAEHQTAALAQEMSR